MATDESGGPDGRSPIATDEALAHLDREAFPDLVTDFWTERGWTVRDEQPLDGDRVNVRLRQQWPRQRTGLLQIRPDAPSERASSAEIRQFVQAVQREDVDVAYLVSATPLAESVRETAAEFGVVVVEPDGLAELIDRASAHDLLAERLARPVAPMTEPYELPWLLGRLHQALDRLPYSARLTRWVDRRVPANPTSADVTRATYTGFRLAYLLAVAVFLLLFAVQRGSLASLALLFVAVSVTYGGLLPTLAADIYVTRRADASSWTPAWWTLLAFVLYPLPLLVGGLYWYRRQAKTPIAEHRTGEGHPT